jgi:hypothetical protein
MEDKIAGNSHVSVMLVGCGAKRVTTKEAWAGANSGTAISKWKITMVYL